MKKFTLALAMALIFALGLTPGVLVATTTTYNTPITTEGGCIIGTGCDNRHFTEVSDGAGSFIDLEVMERGVGASYVPVGNIYNVPTGTSVGGRAFWNVSFKYTTPIALVNYILGFKITDIDAPASVLNPWSFSPALIPDNDYYGVGGKTTGLFATYGGTKTSLGDSENLTFLGIFPGFNPNANHTYHIEGSISGLAGPPILLDDIYVNAGSANYSGVPEPSSLVLLGSGAALFAFGTWRKKKRGESVRAQ